MMRAVGGTVWRDTGTLRSSSAGGSKEAGIWYTYVRRDSLFLFSTLASKDLFVAKGHDSLPPAGWDGYASGVAVLDLNGDRQLEAIVTVTSGMDARPRGIYVLDYATGRSLWTYQTGPALLGASFVDTDGDSRTELLLGSGAYKNGGSANGTSDDSSYAFLLSDSGQLCWVTPIGRYSSEASAVPWISDRGHEPRVLVYEVGNEAGERACDSVFILDGRSGVIMSRRQVGRFTNCGSVAYGTHGRTRLALGGADDTLRILDESLSIESKLYVPGSIRQVCAGSFSRAGQEEWAVVTNDGRLLLLDAALRLRAETTCEATGVTVFLRTVRCAGKERLLVQDSGSQNRWLLYDFKLVPALQQRIPLAAVLVGLALLLASFTAILLLLRHRQTRDVRAVVRSLTGQAGVLELDHRGRVRHANPKGRELLKLAGVSESAMFAGALVPLGGPVRPGAGPRELPLSLSSGQTLLARATPVKSGILLTLEDISTVEYLKRVSTWVPVAQKLAHDIKNPLTAMSLTLQRVEKAAGPDSQRYVESMKDDIDRLKKMADGFMRLTKLEPPKLAPADVNEVVRQCAGKFDGVKPAGVAFSYDLAEGLPSVALDRDQMAVACSNIIENSVSAMSNSGVLTIRTSLAVSRKLLAVSFTDTGKGIPERYLSKVFEPYFTLKPGGTGLGMALTKRIIDDHKGTIRIESKEGVGTTVTIELPVT